MNGDSATRAWIGWYTRGLPTDVGAARRAEIASDLWEHRAASGRRLRTEVAILSRSARGMPADLSWRRAQPTRLRLLTPGQVARAVGWAIALLSYLFLVVAHGYGATALVGFELYGSDWEPGDVSSFSRISALVLLLLVAGALLLERLPRTGASLLALGALATPIAFPWSAPLSGPIGLAVAMAGVVLARRLRARQLRARSATS